MVGVREPDSDRLINENEIGELVPRVLVERRIVRTL